MSARDLIVQHQQQHAAAVNAHLAVLMGGKR